MRTKVSQCETYFFTEFILILSIQKTHNATTHSHIQLLTAKIWVSVVSGILWWYPYGAAQYSQGSACLFQILWQEAICVSGENSKLHSSFVLYREQKCLEFYFSPFCYSKLLLCLVVVLLVQFYLPDKTSLWCCEWQRESCITKQWLICSKTVYEWKSYFLS